MVQDCAEARFAEAFYPTAKLQFFGLIGRERPERTLHLLVVSQLFMKTKILLIRLLIAFLPVALLGCQPEENPVISTCLLTSATDQLVESSGKLTDELNRFFTYTGSKLTSITEKSTQSDAVYVVEYTNDRVVRATNGQRVITLGYGSGTKPTSSTLSLNGIVQSTFSMEYNESGRMTKIVEDRRVLPNNSLTTQRAYTFVYDNTGNLSLERARFTLNDGSVVEQETEYQFDTKPSAYKRFLELPLLTVVALSQPIETRPGRLWHANNCTALQSYNINNGSRSNIRESSTFTPVYDAENKVVSQDQNARLFQASVPNPVTKNNKQTFSYVCE